MKAADPEEEAKLKKIPIEEAEARVTELEKQVEDLSEEVQDLKEINEKLKVSSSKERKPSMTINENLKKQIIELDSQKEELEAQVIQLKDRILQLEEEAQALKNRPKNENEEDDEVFNPKEGSDQELSQSRIISNSSQSHEPSMNKNKDLFGDDHKRQELG